MIGLGGVWRGQKEKNVKICSGMGGGGNKKKNGQTNIIIVNYLGWVYFENAAKSILD